MASDKSAILYLFNRPTEPVFVPKGEEKVAFDIPANYLPDRYRRVATQVLSRFDDEAKVKIPVKQIPLPDLTIPMQLGRRAAFSLFIPMHQKMAARLIDIFMGMKTYEDFLSVAVYCRDRLNPYMFIYALSVAILHRPDTKSLLIPPLSEVFPNKFVAGEVLDRVREEAQLVPADSREPIVIPQDWTASDLDMEHRLAYFREDIGVNLHHWHWHLVYPSFGNIDMVNKDRRGELFFYMHEQIVARYNSERLCNKLGRVTRFIHWHEPIPEAYFPKLDNNNASRVYPARANGAIIKDINRPDIPVAADIQDLERWRDRIHSAIYTGAVINQKGERELLTEKTGIDVLGNMVESSSLSPNQGVYGDLHNMGHSAIAYCHDPNNHYLEDYAVMGDPTTAMRDPIFYRWHAFIDDIFQKYKDRLPEYAVNQLDFLGVQITDIGLTTDQESNVLNTFWTQSEVDLTRGMNFNDPKPVLVKFTHLNHAEFSYNITVNNRNKTQVRGTVRIFIAPKEDERGQPFPYRQQKNMMIEMDKFTVQLNPGSNTITRKSTESSVTIPFEQTFRDLNKNKPPADDDAASNAFNFCGCGWPQHLLVPKGTKEGYPMELFVMVSDYNGDAVQQDEPAACKDAVSYCGLRNNKYPDARSMGYPFDRLPRSGVDTLAQFLTKNMAVKDITVRFSDTVVPRVKPGTVGKTATLS